MADGPRLPTSASADTPPRRLVILACSAAKRPGAEPMPARERYDGPVWRTLRAADPDGSRAVAAFLSARYGFRAADTPIEHYDARLTPDLAARMIAGGMTTRWPRPPSQRRPDSYGVHPGAEIASLARYGREPFTDVALVGGALYLDVMRAFVAGFGTLGCVTTAARVLEINGAIGAMRRELRRWLDEADGAPAGPLTVSRRATIAYEGRIGADGIRWVVRLHEGGGGSRLHPRNAALRNHSPAGLSWGYGGSGPAQCALALLADALADDARALRLYQAFKWRVVARLDQDGGWTLTTEEVRAAAAAIEAECGAANPDPD